jgi:hypothetical protein
MGDLKNNPRHNWEQKNIPSAGTIRQYTRLIQFENLRIGSLTSFKLQATVFACAVTADKCYFLAVTSHEWVLCSNVVLISISLNRYDPGSSPIFSSATVFSGSTVSFRLISSLPITPVRPCLRLSPQFCRCGPRGTSAFSKIVNVSKLDAKSACISSKENP